MESKTGMMQEYNRVQNRERTTVFVGCAEIMLEKGTKADIIG
jgi:hypothetical protein